MTLMPVRPARSRRGAPVQALYVALLLALVTSGQFLAVPRAAAVGAPVVIDDFAGTVLGTRTVTTLPASGTSTTASGTFNQAGGIGTMTMNGNGNGSGGVQLDYAFAPTDLRSGSSNNQFFLQFASIQRTPVGSEGETAANISIQVTDSTNAVSSFNTGVPNVDAFNVVLNFDCSQGGTCFSPAVNFSAIKKVTVLVLYPTNHDATASLTARVDTIRTTPPGGAVPAAPNATLSSSATGDPYYAPAGTTVDVTIPFTSGGAAVPVDHTPGTGDGLLAGDIALTGTAPGRTSVAVTGGPSSFTAAIGPLTGSGSVTVQIPAGVVTDSWGQTNTASTPLTIDYVVPVPPTLMTATLPAALAGSAYSTQIAASGAPAPTFTVTTGSLPAGLTLSSSGVLSGTPTASGAKTFGIAATNPFGTDPRTYTLIVNGRPTFPTQPVASYRIGEPVDTTLTVSGMPQPTLSIVGTLPPGLGFTPTPGGGQITGTPTGAGGTTSVTLSATNSQGTVTQAYSITVNATPAFTSPDTATFSLDAAGSFTVTTAGYPDIALSLGGGLPTGLAFVDNGDGTATISGTPTGPAQRSVVTVQAVNSAGGQLQSLNVDVVTKPVFTTPATAAVVIGSPASIQVGTTAYPVPTLMATTPPAGMSFSDNGNGTATLSGTPTGPAGTSTLTVTATNSVGSSTQDLVITTDAGPQITSPATATFTRGVSGVFTVTSTGSPTPVVTAGDLPDGLSISSNPDGTATIAGTPTGTGGQSTATVTAGSRAGIATQVLTIVIEAAPVISSVNTATFTVGSPGTFTLTTTGFPVPAITEVGALPSGLSFVDLGNGTATVSGTPTGAGGTATVTATASNGVGSTPQTLTLVVNEAPAITSSATVTRSAGEEGNPFTVTTTGFPTPEIMVTGTLPPGMFFADNGTGTATLTGAATVSGTYPVTLTASNGVGVPATQQLTIVVDSASVITSEATAVFEVGQQGTFTVTTDGQPTATLTAAGDLPAGLSFVDNGDGSATVAGTPSSVGGEFPITVTAKNYVGQNQQVLTLVVKEAPAITSPDLLQTAVGRATSFTITTSGYPKPALTLAEQLPAGLTFADNGNGTATISGVPTERRDGDLDTLTADNGVGTPAVQRLSVIVDEAPVFLSGDTVVFDKDGAGGHDIVTDGRPVPTLTLTGDLPAGLTFTANGGGRGSIDGTPTVGGRTTLVVTAANGIDPAATQTLTIIVRDAAQITSAARLTASVGRETSFTVTTTGFPVPAISADDLPPGTTFTDNEDGTGTLAGAPTTPGVYEVHVRAVNDTGVTQILTVTVDEGAAITSEDVATFDLGTPGSFTVTTDGQPVAEITQEGDLPDGLTFTDNGDGTATIAGTPTEDGPYAARLTAANGVGDGDVQDLLVAVRSSPEFDSPAAASFTAGTPGSFEVSSFGFPPPALTIDRDLPAGLTFTDHGDGTGTISGTPAATSAGRYPVTLTATTETGSSPDSGRRFAFDARSVTSALAFAAAGRPATGTATQVLTITVRPAAGLPSLPSLPSPPSLPSLPMLPGTSGGTSSSPGGTSSTPGGRPHGNLPATGSPVLPWTGGGLLLLLVGTVLLVSRSRARGGRVTG